MIYKSNNIKKAEKAPAFPLGVSLKDGILRAAVSVQGGKYCRILLREYIPSRELTENKSDTSAENGKKGKNGCGTEYSSWDVYELAPAPVFTGIYIMRHVCEYQFKSVQLGDGWSLFGHTSWRSCVKVG